VGARPRTSAPAPGVAEDRLGGRQASARAAVDRSVTFLGLLRIRVAETQATDTWPNLRRELQRMHLGELDGPAGRVLQRTDTTAGQRRILTALQVPEPPRFLAIEPPAGA
jgi:hypothetical protein